MQTQEGPGFFDQAAADKYDQQAARLGPLRDALLFLISAVFSNLPATARGSSKPLPTNKCNVDLLERSVGLAAFLG